MKQFDISSSKLTLEADMGHLQVTTSCLSLPPGEKCHSLPKM